MASNVTPAKPLNAADSTSSPERDGDPVRSRNGGQVIPVTCVNISDSDGPGRSDDTPSLGTGRSVPSGPCA